MKTWVYFWLCQLIALVLFVLGLLPITLACIFKAWHYPYRQSIKPNLIGVLPRQYVDGWTWLPNSIYGNPEDGVSGVEALGPDWTGFYNPTGSRWGAFVWNLRNRVNGFNYLTWRTATIPPLKTGTWLFGRAYKLGWQQLPTSDGWVTQYRVRMVFSA